MNRPAPISVLITYYREKELVRRCVESLLNGTRTVTEIVIYDDASPEPAKDYLPTHPLIRIIRGEKNVGPSVGRNRLLQAANAEFVHFHDSDDWFMPTWCEKVASELEKHGADVVYTEINSYRNGALYRENVVEVKKVADGMDLVAFSLNHALLVPAGTYRTSLMRRLGGYRENLWQSEDFEFHARLVMTEPKTRILTEALAGIELRDESRSQNRAQVWQCRLAALRLLFLDLAPKYYPTFIEALCSAGCHLFELGDAKSAQDAYALALQLGTPHYLGRSLSFRWLARALGPFRAERVGVAYRSLLPEPLRRLLRGPEHEQRPSGENHDPLRKAS